MLDRTAEDADIDDVQPALFRKVERDDFSDLKERIAAFARPVFNKLEAVECSASLVTLFQSKSIDSKDRRGCKTSAGTIEGWLVKNGVGSDDSDGSQQQLVAVSTGTSESSNQGRDKRPRTGCM